MKQVIMAFSFCVEEVLPCCDTAMLRLTSKYASRLSVKKVVHEGRSGYCPHRHADRRSRARQHADRADGRPGADGDRAVAGGRCDGADGKLASLEAGRRRP